MAEPAVRVEDIVKVYEPSEWWMKILLRSSVSEPVRALDGVSIEVSPGEICAVVGPNGAGKSTLFRILTGLTTPTSGRATIQGHDCTVDSARVRALVGFMPAEVRTVWLRHSCRENLQFHGRLQGMPEAKVQQRIGETLDLVGLGRAADRVGFALSSGMLARLMLARALFHEPPILILDEPTGSVDPVGSYELIELIKRVTKERNLAVLLSSHRIDEIEALHDSVLLLNEGRQVFAGDLDELRAMWERPRITIEFDSEESAGAAEGELARIRGVQEVERVERNVILECDIPIGTVLQGLNGSLPGIVSLNQTRLRLHELLAKILIEDSREAT